jgi:tetratricopeptide (TPR) repeat protein
MEINRDFTTHKKMAMDLFNLTWDLIEKTDRTENDDDMMLYAANASRYHWSVVGTPLNFARGEWQISRVYAILGRSEAALHHARKSLSLCTEHQLGDFDLAFAYEALARAYHAAGNSDEQERYLSWALQTAEKVEQEDNKNWLLKNITSVSTGAIPV